MFSLVEKINSHSPIVLGVLGSWIRGLFAAVPGPQIPIIFNRGSASVPLRGMNGTLVFLPAT